MKFFHGAHNVGYVFDDVGRMHMIERTILKRIGEIVQIADHIRATGGVAINANGASQFIDPAADVEHFSCSNRAPVHALPEYPTRQTIPLPARAGL